MTAKATNAVSMRSDREKKTARNFKKMGNGMMNCFKTEHMLLKVSVAKQSLLNNRCLTIAAKQSLLNNRCLTIAA